MNEKADRGTRACMPMRDGLLDRQHDLLPGKGLANDRRKEPGGRLVGAPRPHRDGRQPDTDAIEEAAPAVFGEQKLDDRLLGPVRGQRRQMKIIGDRLREWRSEHGDRGGENKARAITLTGLADRFQKRARRVEVDARALLEIKLRLSRDDRRKMKNNIRPPGDRCLYDCRFTNVGGEGADDARKFFWPFRSADVDKRKLLDRPAVERTSLNKARRQLAPDHSRGAGNQNVHGCLLTAYNAIPPSTRCAWPVM